MKITKTVIENTQKAAADVWVWDSEVPGFGIRVQPSGRKTYVCRYRTQSRTQRKHTISRCSDLTPDRARDLARKVFGQVAEGRDPQLVKQEMKDAPTVVDLEERYMREHAKPFKKPNSVAADERNWRLYILPALGKKKARDVSEEDILALFGSLSFKPATGNQVLALISKSMNLAEKWRWRDKKSNPATGIKKYDITEKELILTHEQIGDMNRAIDELVTEKEITYEMACLVRLLLLTGCRKNEIMQAKREWIDVDRQLLLLPDSKVGQRKIPLSKHAMAIIATMAKGEKWLIPGRVNGEPLQTPYKPWSLIKKHAKLPKELRLHDLRHTYGSLGHGAGLSQKQIQTQLGHKQMSTTERYLHGVKSEQAAAADKVGDMITQNWLPKVPELVAA